MSTTDSKRTDLIALLLVLAGGALLALTFAQPTPAEPDYLDLSETLDLEVDTSRLLADRFTFTSDVLRPEKPSILAMFALHAKVCPPCLNEVEEYFELLQEISWEGVDIEPLAVVFEPDGERALRFLQVSDLQLPAAYGYSEELAVLLGQLDEAQPLQQIVFVDPSRKTWFFKVLLPNRMTPREYKQDILQQMLAAKEQRG